MRDKISKNIVPGVVFLVFGLVMYFLMPGQIKTTETSAFTARTFPTMALGLIMLCGALLIVQGFWAILQERRNTPRTEAQKEAAEVMSKQGNPLRLLAVLALMVISVVVGNYAGLLVSGLMIGIGFLVVYRDKKLLHYVIVAVIVTVSYFLFKQVFGLQLP